jgi:ribosomal protein L44E
MEHFTLKTEEVLAYCSRCGRYTMHSVSCGRKGHCLDHQTPVRAKRPKRKQLHLFERMDCDQ